MMDEQKDENLAESEEAFYQPPAEPENPAETARKTGLAFSVGIVFFSSVAASIVFGYLADVFFDSSPKGLIIGIVLGSIVGFIKIFKLTSQIFNK